MRTARALAAAALVVVAVGVAGCSDDEPSAEDRLCDARSDLSATYDGIVSDVASLNLGAARDKLPALRDALDDYADAAADLSTEKRAEVQPDLDKAKASLTSLQDATTLQQVGAALDSARGSFTAAIDKAQQTGDCG